MISLIDLIDQVFDIKTQASWRKIWQIVISKLCTRSAPFDIIFQWTRRGSRYLLISSLIMSISVIPVKQVKTNRSRLHSKKDHDFWMKRNGFCPYCNSGSKPVKKSEIVKEL